MSEGDYQREIERCRREMAAIRAELLAGNPDVAGLCLALADWAQELRILQRERELQARALMPPASSAPSAESQVRAPGAPGADHTRIAD